MERLNQPQLSPHSNSGEQKVCTGGLRGQGGGCYLKHTVGEVDIDSMMNKAFGATLVPMDGGYRDNVWRQC